MKAISHGKAVRSGIVKSDEESLKETSYLKSIPGMTASIKKGMKEPLSKCANNIDL